MKREVRWHWVVLGLTTLLAAGFGYLNSRELVAVNLGFFVFYQVRLTLLVLFSFLLGMLTMFLLGLRYDLKVRRLLKERQLQAREYRPLSPYAPPDHDR
jgi:uncharacterized integral membrane protein